MKCERVEEFLSAYVERDLDTLLQGRVEDHLHRCAPCTRSLQELQTLWSELEALPEVEAPRDGEWQVLCAVRRAGQAQATQAPQALVSFTHWLRCVRPAGVAMGAGVATLLVAGSFWMTRGPEIQLGFLSSPEAATVTIPSGHVVVAAERVPGAGTMLTVKLAAQDAAGDGSRVVSAGRSLPLRFDCASACTSRITVPASGHSQVLRLVLPTAADAGRSLNLVVPPSRRSDSAITRSWVDRDLVRVASDLGPSLGRVVVIDASLNQRVTLQVDEASGIRCLEEAAARAGGELVREPSVYRIVARR